MDVSEAPDRHVEPFLLDVREPLGWAATDADGAVHVRVVTDDGSPGRVA